MGRNYSPFNSSPGSIIYFSTPLNTVVSKLDRLPSSIKLIVVLVMELHPIPNRRLNDTFTKSSHCTPSLDLLNSSTPYFRNLNIILILPSHLRLGLPYDLFPSDFLNKMYAFSIFLSRATCPPISYSLILSR
jgi:hypothetical protein